MSAWRTPTTNNPFTHRSISLVKCNAKHSGRPSPPLLKEEEELSTPPRVARYHLNTSWSVPCFLVIVCRL